MLLRKRLLVLFVISITSGALLGFLGGFVNITHNSVQAEEGEMSLGTGKRKVIAVDFQRVVFPHKRHQQIVLEIAGNDKESACRICHHKKRTGRDPRACRRCHAGRMQKAKGEDRCLSGCHVKAKRNDLIKILKELPGKGARKGQLIKLKDAFHLNCKNCHVRFRAMNMDLDSTKYMAPVEYCEGCHVPKSKEDRDKLEAAKEIERKEIGNSIEAIKAFIKESAQQ